MQYVYKYLRMQTQVIGGKGIWIIEKKKKKKIQKFFIGNKNFRKVL